ncbi:MAG: putative bifunctional diguanylate cyclase/phosphodiesterase [Solirubrobacterales bacterium]
MSRRPRPGPAADPGAGAGAGTAWREALLGDSRLLVDTVAGRGAHADDAHPAGHVAALHLDLSGFAALNTSLGHLAGDELLQEVELDLRASLRQDDLFARSSGDEFVVVSATGVAGAVALARRLLDAVARPRQVAGHRLTLGACVGVAVGAVGGTTHPAAADGPLTPEGLLLHADTALGQAKRGGPGTVHLFRPEGALDGGARLDLVADLAAAPEDGTLRLHYQPIVDLGTGETVRREALLRWEHEGRLLAPDHFLPLAEAHGLMRRIGTWVLTRACRDGAAWAAHGDPCGVTVNLAAAQVTPDLPGQVDAALRAGGLPAALLSVEVTETSVLADVDLATAVLDALDERGVHILLDDFGTGFSSFAYLKELPVQHLKLDIEFIRNLPSSPVDQKLVQAMVQFAKAFGQETVAEGIEDAETLSMVRAFEVDYAQGFHIGEPALVDCEQLPAAG